MCYCYFHSLVPILLQSFLAFQRWNTSQITLARMELSLLNYGSFHYYINLHIFRIVHLGSMILTLYLQCTCIFNTSVMARICSGPQAWNLARQMMSSLLPPHLQLYPLSLSFVGIFNFVRFTLLLRLFTPTSCTASRNNRFVAASGRQGHQSPGILIHRVTSIECHRLHSLWPTLLYHSVQRNYRRSLNTIYPLCPNLFLRFQTNS